MTWASHHDIFTKTNPDESYTLEEVQEKFKKLQEEAYNAKVFRDAAQESLDEAQEKLEAIEAERDELQQVIEQAGKTPVLVTQWGGIE